MTTDDILKWVAIKQSEIFIGLGIESLSDIERSYIKGKYDVLNFLRLHIIMKTNPHNREDIKRVNEREENG